MCCEPRAPSPHRGRGRPIAHSQVRRHKAKQSNSISDDGNKRNGRKFTEFISSHLPSSRKNKAPVFYLLVWVQQDAPTNWV